MNLIKEAGARQGPFTPFTEMGDGPDKEVRTAYNEHWRGLKEKAEADLSVMTSEKEIREKTEKWSPVSRWVAQEQIAAAIEKNRSTEHNLAIL